MALRLVEIFLPAEKEQPLLGPNVSLALGAAMLFAVNLICINLAGVMTFLMQGVSPLWSGNSSPKRQRRDKSDLARLNNRQRSQKQDVYYYSHQKNSLNMDNITNPTDSTDHSIKRMAEINNIDR